MESSKINIRKCKKEDAEQIASLYNKFGYGPITSGYPLKDKDIVRFFDEFDIILYLCLEYENKIIATMLFSKFCGQKAAEEDAVWGSNFLISPQFRNGPLPGRFFSESIKQLSELGYKYINVDVDPTNSSALPLYKRVGFIRNSNAYIDYDGYLELRCYLPYLVNYLKQGYNVEHLDNSLVESGWRTLLSAKDFRSIQQDTFNLNGMETILYKMKFGNGMISCWIDILTEKVAMLKDPRFQFCSYIVEGQQLNIGQEITIEFEYKNRLSEQVLVDFKSEFCGQPLIYNSGKSHFLLQSGESVTWKETLVIKEWMKGKGELVTSLRYGDCTFDFHYGIKITSPIEISLPKHVSLVENSSANIMLKFKNNTFQPIKGRISVETTNPLILLVNDLSVTDVNINAQEEIFLPVKVISQNAGISKLQTTITSDSRETQSIDFIIPVIKQLETVRYEQWGYMYLENQRILLKVNASNGGLTIIERTTGKQLVEEAWPDLGYPFKSTVKRMVKRKLHTIAPNTKIDTWVILEEQNGCIVLIRKIVLSSEGVVKIEDYVISDQSVLRINPWCGLRDAVISIPFKSGIVTDTQVYEDFPYLIHDFEYARDLELPSNPDAYSMEWSAFENNELTVGMIWQGNVKEVLYGLRWMPALIFQTKDSLDDDYDYMIDQSEDESIPKNELYNLVQQLSSKKANAIHYFSIGYGGAKEVERNWKSFVGNTRPRENVHGKVRFIMKKNNIVMKDERISLKGKVQTELLNEFSGLLELKIPSLDIEVEQFVNSLSSVNPFSWQFDIGGYDGPGVVDGTISFKNEYKGLYIKEHVCLIFQKDSNPVVIEKNMKKLKEIYKVSNSIFEFEVAPEFQGAIIRLNYLSKNLLKSNFPNYKNWGQNTSTPIGIHSQTLLQEISLNKGPLFEESALETFVPEVIDQSEGWSGIRLRGTGYEFSYLIMTGIPVLRLDVSLNKRTEIVNWILHSFWNKFGEARSAYFWNSEGQQYVKEAGIRRRIYTSVSQVLLELGNRYYVTCWVDEEEAEILIYEWPDKGFQISVVQPTENSDKITIYFAFSRSLEEAMAYIHKEKRIR
ncbi:N-acetyltransferase family protein [Cerasibacillus sp. JNUCC 74]